MRFLCFYGDIPGVWGCACLLVRRAPRIHIHSSLINASKYIRTCMSIYSINQAASQFGHAGGTVKIYRLRMYVGAALLIAGLGGCR
ncbi:hypothetical protein BDV95DRAFT_586207 [Massariosphaeria phaeospora]|uniref:Uncharacterized protein n=1 Tax=Massariosphaeria phaeospora TaxID=100035 RepID=A0A7C8I5G8_9PLEO|nr:hypothetical protein BDV95DRAFT_586207 [Massariosphaeria phaeospora]